jgi:hypothetical protein
MGTVSCQAMWKRTKFCSPITLESGNEDKIIALGEGYWKAMQELKSFPNVQISDKLWREQFTADDLSIDCFHAGLQGQQRIADIFASEFVR